MGAFESSRLVVVGFQAAHQILEIAATRVGVLTLGLRFVEENHRSVAREGLIAEPFEGNELRVEVDVLRTPREVFEVIHVVDQHRVRRDILREVLVGGRLGRRLKRKLAGGGRHLRYKREFFFDEALAGNHFTNVVSDRARADQEGVPHREMLEMKREVRGTRNS